MPRSFPVTVVNCNFSELLNIQSPNKSPESLQIYTCVNDSSTASLWKQNTAIAFYKVFGKQENNWILCTEQNSRASGTWTEHFCFVEHVLKHRILKCHITSIFTNWVYLHLGTVPATQQLQEINVKAFLHLETIVTLNLQLLTLRVADCWSWCLWATDGFLSFTDNENDIIYLLTLK